LRRGEPDEWVVTARWRLKDGQELCRDFTLGTLRDCLVKETLGQKIAYVVDTLYSRENAARVAELAHDADLFFCESPFLDADEDQATRRYHLTARQAGLLGRAAGAKKLVVFHFSPRYSGQAECLYREAQDVFRQGEVGVEPGR
jgi:ribonuclease Z